MWLFTCAFTFVDPLTRLLFFTIPCGVWGIIFSIHLFLDRRYKKRREEETFSQTILPTENQTVTQETQN